MRFFQIITFFLFYIYIQGQDLESWNPNKSIFVGYRCDYQKMDIFHNAVILGNNEDFELGAYLGIGHRNSFSGATFFPQLGIQFNRFFFKKLNTSLPKCYLNLDFSKAFLDEPFKIQYTRYHVGIGFNYLLPRSFFSLHSQMGFALLLEEFRKAPYSQNTLLDYRFSLGLCYELQ